MHSSPLERDVCLVLKGGGFSRRLLSACLWEAVRMIHAKEQRFDVSNAHVRVCIRNRECYQVVGDFGGVLVEVRVESDVIDTTLTMLVNPCFSAPVVGQWDDVVLDGNHWRLADEAILWD